MNFYDWKLNIYFIQKGDNLNRLIDNLEYLRCPNIERIVYKINNFKDCAFIYTRNKESVIIVANWMNVCQLINSLTHEIDHLLNEMYDVWDIDSKSEEAAVLTGDLYAFIMCKMLFKIK